MFVCLFLLLSFSTEAKCFMKMVGYWEREEEIITEQRRGEIPSQTDLHTARRKAAECGPLRQTDGVGYWVSVVSQQVI